MRVLKLAGVGLALATVLRTVPALAGDEAAAEALFEEAKKLADAGKYAEACPKFAESNRLDRGAGTLIHLGDCYEKNKQSASAWAIFKEASSAAQALNRKDWEKLATQRANALEPKLARLTVKVESTGDAEEVSRDRTEVAPAAWGLGIPVDVGPHTVEAKMAGYLTFTTTVTVAKDGEKLEVQVPKLDVDPAANAPPPTTPVVAPVVAPVAAPPDADKGDGSGQRTVGFVIAGVGAAGVVLGAVTGLMAISKANDAKNKCPTDGNCPFPEAVDASKSARTLGTVSTIGFIAGGVGIIGGAVLILTAPKKQTGIRILPNAGPRDAGLTVLGVF